LSLTVPIPVSEFETVPIPVSEFETVPFPVSEFETVPIPVSEFETVPIPVSEFEKGKGKHCFVYLSLNRIEFFHIFILTLI
jgi:hypothetical protein